MELSGASVHPEGKGEAWVSAAHRLNPGRRHLSPSPGEEEVFLAACAGISGFICPPEGGRQGWMLSMEGQFAKYPNVVSANFGFIWMTQSGIIEFLWRNCGNFKFNVVKPAACNKSACSCPYLFKMLNLKMNILKRKGRQHSRFKTFFFPHSACTAQTANARSL